MTKVNKIENFVFFPKANKKIYIDNNSNNRDYLPPQTPTDIILNILNLISPISNPNFN